MELSKFYYWVVIANYDWLSRTVSSEPSPYLLDTLEFIKARYFTIFTLPNVSSLVFSPLLILCSLLERHGATALCQLSTPSCTRHGECTAGSKCML